MITAVCVKEVVDARAPLGPLGEDGAFDEAAIVYVPNPGDLVALEAALRLREEIQEGEVMAVTVGPRRAQTTLRTCLAMGADRAVRIDTTGNGHDDPVLVAKLLARWLSETDYDLIFLGTASADCGTGQVPAHLAGLLDRPLVCAVTRVSAPNEDGRIGARRKLDRGDSISVMFPTPAVITIDIGAAVPRYASLPALVAALDHEIAVVAPGDLGPSQVGATGASSWLSRAALVPPRRRPKKTYAPSSSLSPADRIRELMSGGVARKSGEIWTGTAEVTAGKLLELLIDERVVERPR